MDFAGEIFSAPSPCETPESINQAANVRHKKTRAVGINLLFPISGIPSQMLTIDKIERVYSIPLGVPGFTPSTYQLQQLRQRDCRRPPCEKKTTASSSHVSSCLFDGLTYPSNSKWC
jgi:hypothetical protein